ncbi:MAG: ABC transporter ATP-binding protein [Balneolaceae bacterium]
MQSESILRTDSVSKSYKNGERSLTVLDRVSISIEPGISVAVTGPSGSGKTTLLGLCAGLDHPSEGDIFLKNHHLNRMDEDQLAAIRNRYTGFVFQSFQLIPTLTAIENVMVPAELRGGAYTPIYNRALELLRSVGLEERTGHYPTQLSGGEQQRVGIARAFINRPEILFADEPTGNLDTETGRQIEEILFELNRREGTTLIIVTHDLDLAGQCDRVIRLRSGSVASDLYTADSPHAQPEVTTESP